MPLKLSPRNTPVLVCRCLGVVNRSHRAMMMAGVPRTQTMDVDEPWLWGAVEGVLGTTSELIPQICQNTHISLSLLLGVTSSLGLLCYHGRKINTRSLLHRARPRLCAAGWDRPDHHREHAAPTPGTGATRPQIRAWRPNFPGATREAPLDPHPTS